MQNDNNCDVCGEDVCDRQWILLNRFGVGTGECRGFREFVANDGTDWSHDGDGNPGALMCWPNCARMYIDAMMVEVEVMVAQQEKDGE